MQFAEPGSFEIRGGILSLPNKETITVLSGNLSVSQDASGLKTWTARLHLSVPKSLRSAVDSTEIVGAEFSWSGKAFVKTLNYEWRDICDVELREMSGLYRTPLQHTRPLLTAWSGRNGIRKA